MISKTSLKTSPIKKLNEKWARSNQENHWLLFAEHLENTFKPNDIDIRENLSRKIIQYFREIKPVTPKEVLEEIKTNIN